MRVESTKRRPLAAFSAFSSSVTACCLHPTGVGRPKSSARNFLVVCLGCQPSTSSSESRRLARRGCGKRFIQTDGFGLSQKGRLPFQKPVDIECLIVEQNRIGHLSRHLQHVQHLLRCLARRRQLNLQGVVDPLGWNRNPIRGLMLAFIQNPDLRQFLVASDLDDETAGHGQRLRG